MRGSNDSLEFDLIVVGGGPAGSTVATFVAMQGHRVLLLEKEKSPTYKIGESLLPATIHGICPMLGVSKALKDANFVTKLGGTFRWGKSSEPWTFSFASSSKMPGGTSTAYQVERMKFDAILLKNAIEKGVDVREQHRVTDIRVENGRVCGLEFIDHAGTLRAIRARYVVDASGHATSLSKHVGERVYSEFFQNVSLFGYYRNGARLPRPNEGNILCAAFEYGWFWYIPLGTDLTSVGVVIAREHAARLTEGYERAMEDFIRGCPIVEKLLSGASRIADGPYGQLRVRKDYSYCQTKFWCPGLVLIGDAACFVDPVFSSGVHLATYSALLAARSINSYLKCEVEEEQYFREFEGRYRREFLHFYDFLLAFYDANKDTDSYFWRARQIVNSKEASHVAFINLIAGVGSEEKLYMSEEEFLQNRARWGATLFPSVAGESEATPSDRTRSATFYNELLDESVQLQLQTWKLSPRQLPLLPNGLTVSRDGLHWVRNSGR